LWYFKILLSSDLLGVERGIVGPYPLLHLLGEEEMELTLLGICEHLLYSRQSLYPPFLI
jgi:hypothetical protein